MNQSYCPRCSTTENRNPNEQYKCDVCGLITEPDVDNNEHDEQDR